MEYITLLALFLGPVLAVLVGAWLENRKEKRTAKRWLLYALVSNRHARLDNDVIKAMNSIDVVFADDKEVRARWKEYLKLTEADLSAELNLRNLDNKYIELVHAMAQVLGLAGKISQIQVSEAYTPQLVGTNQMRSEALIEGLIGVLSGKTPLAVVAFQEPIDPALQATLIEQPESAEVPGVSTPSEKY